ncbi:MAG: hypothetical protein ABSG95_04125 [Solirubrobacteraceae bacterium]
MLLAMQAGGDGVKPMRFAGVHMGERQLPFGIGEARRKRDRVAAAGPTVDSH